MKLLVTTAHPTLYQHQDPEAPGVLHPNLGRLLQPRHTSSASQTAFDGIPWACDNDCFNGLDRQAFDRMLAVVADLPGCQFVTVPDVVRCVYCRRTVDGFGSGEACECSFSKGHPKIVAGDAELTALRFEEWQPIVEAAGQPVGLVLQDGQEDVEIPWTAIDAVFVGGSTDFKLGPVARAACEEAKALGKWVHVGRVNTKRRFDLIASWDCIDSFDGSKFARWRKTHLGTGLSWCRELERQTTLDLAAA